MGDVRNLIRVAETHPPAAPELPEQPDYVDDERPEVTSGSKMRAPWRIEDDGAAEWAIRRKWEAEDEITRITAAHAGERARLLAQVALIDARVAEITMSQRRRSAFFEALILEWMSRVRTALVKGKQKSRKFLYGTVGWKQSPEKFVYDDEAKAVSWARAQGLEAGLVRIEWRLEKDAIKRHCAAHEIVPDGAHTEGGEDVPFVRVEPPAVAAKPTPAPQPQSLQIVKETP